MENLDLMARFADPNLFEQLTAAEKIQGALVTTVMGMGVTFVVLAFLWGVIALMTKILYKGGDGSGGKKSEAEKATAASGTVPSSEAIETVDLTKDSQLVAVIMAAISASCGNEFKNNLVVRKINRISGDTPAWGTAGQREAIDSRRI